MKILVLPFLAFVVVIKQMELIDLFELSQVSRRTFHMIKRAKRKILPLRVNKGTNEQEVSIIERVNEEPTLTFYFDLVLPRTVRHIKLDECTIEISEKNVANKNFRCVSVQKPVDMVSLLSYLMNLFENDKLTLEMVDPYRMRVDRELSDPIYLKCVDVTTAGKFMVTTKEIEYLLQKTQPSHSLTLRSLLMYPFSHKSFLNIPRYAAKYASDIKIEDLENMTCEDMFLSGRYFNARSINSFLHHWNEGNLQNLRRLRITIWSELEWNIILEGLNFRKFDNKKTPKYFKDNNTYTTNEYKVDNGWQIERNDKLLMTITLNQPQSTLYFHVWNHCFLQSK